MLDPMNRFDYLMGRECLVKNEHRLYKPLDKLGRELDSVILLDQYLNVR